MPKIVKPKTMLGKIADKAKVKERSGPLWLGPCDSSPMGGITQSMICSWLSCRERCRLKNVEGLQPTESFRAAIDYGTLWHLCEENTAAGRDWEAPLKETAQKLCLKFPLQQDEIHKWWNVCKVQFPIYCDYWKNDKEEKSKTPLLQEYAFNVPYELPSRRTVYLRGKFDGVDLIGKGKEAGIYLFETKTKSEIDEQRISRQLKFDLQTCLYLTALNEVDLAAICELRGLHVNLPNPVKGVRYNCIRRPLSGGKGNIRPHAATKTKPAETLTKYFNRLREVILEDKDTYFLRLKVEVYQSDIERFKKMCLNPLLEQICDWYEWVTTVENPFVDEQMNLTNRLHYTSPFGLYNPLVENGQTDLDSYLLEGSEVGLQRVETLFPELQ